ncbi:MAG: anthranilate phosphoribosyltransferase [Candidatus Margulisiibacteriota bacterium]
MNFLSKLNRQQSLTVEESQALLRAMFSGDLSLEDTKAALVALRDKGETVDELFGFVTVMREAMTPIHLAHPAIDVCGTGGSGQDRFNTSTAVAFLLASRGIGVAKHGNRGSVLPNGSFDFLETLGIPFDLSVEQHQALYAETNLCFLFARSFHPAVAKLAQARKEIGGRTVFNLLGPLCNPAGVQTQLIGTSSVQNAEKLVDVCKRLKMDRVLVVVSDHGLDELSPIQSNTLFELKNGVIVRKTEAENRMPESLSVTGLGTLQQNATLFESILKGEHRNHLIAHQISLNAGAALYLLGEAASLVHGYMAADSVLRTGAVWKFFESYRQKAQNIKTN